MIKEMQCSKINFALISTNPADMLIEELGGVGAMNKKESFTYINTKALKEVASFYFNLG